MCCFCWSPPFLPVLSAIVHKGIIVLRFIEKPSPFGQYRYKPVWLA